MLSTGAGTRGRAHECENRHPSVTQNYARKSELVSVCANASTNIILLKSRRERNTLKVVMAEVIITIIALLKPMIVMVKMVVLIR